MQFGGCFYILTNKINTVLYIGVTSDLHSRVSEHKEKKYETSFTAKYNCNKLIYYECFSRIEEAIAREKQMKKWKREWKEKLISGFNPHWIDLFDQL
ncbi:MAG: GIY-YIG nuclease family protein [Chitinophagaceae bacterium]